MTALPFIELPLVRSRCTDRRLGQITVSNAKRRGILPLSNDCMMCRDTVTGKNLHHHHEDYAFPCRVTPLCRKCHRQRHEELGWGPGANRLTPGQKRATATFSVPKTFKARLTAAATIEGRKTAQLLRLLLERHFADMDKRLKKKKGKAA